MENAKEKLAEALFMATVKNLTARIKSGEATPSDFKNAIQFLKDNGITVGIRKGPDHLMEGLLAELPFNEEEMN